MNRISVVVPTRDRPDALGRCLDALLAQDLSDGYEVIVVDDAASPATRRQIGALAAHSSPGYLRYVAVTGNHGPAAARNAGWRLARGAHVAFTDDDCIPDTSWLRQGLEVFVDGVAGASGRVVVPLRRTPTDYERNAGQLRHSEFVTANSFYRRDALEAAGGFDERFTLPWREDTDLYFRLLRSGANLTHAPHALVTHPVRQVCFGISLAQQRKSMFNALLFKNHSRLYREKVQPAPPWRYYRIMGFALTSAALALAGRPRHSSLAVTIWGVLTARFCLQRLRGASHHPHHILEMVLTSILIPPLAIFWRLLGAVRFRVRFL